MKKFSELNKEEKEHLIQMVRDIRDGLEVISKRLDTLLNRSDIYGNYPREY